MSYKRPKCAFNNCNNEVMKSTYKNALLSVCKECFDSNRMFPELGEKDQEDPNKIVKDGLIPQGRLPRDSQQENIFPAYYHWERVNMPRFMSHSPAWKRRKTLKGNWSKP